MSGRNGTVAKLQDTRVLPATLHLENRPTPQSLEAEQATLGAMLLERSAVVLVLSTIDAGDFYRELHRKIFTIMLGLFERHEPVDLISVAEELRSSDQPEETGGIAYLTALTEACPAPANVERYAEVVAEKSALRRYIAFANSLLGLVHNDTTGLSQLVEQSQKQFLAIQPAHRGDGLVHVKEVVEQCYSDIAQRLQHKGEARGIATGFQDLDDAILGLRNEDLIILAARPSMGKTSMAWQIAYNVAVNERRPVVGFSLEMPKWKLIDRLICNTAQVDTRRYELGYLDERELSRIQDVRQRIETPLLYIDDERQTKAFDIRTKVQRFILQHGRPALIVVDYINLLQPANSHSNRVEQMSEVARDMQALAREIKVPVLALAQLSRAVEQRENKRPILSDLRESGEIEQVAQAVMFLYRPAYYEQQAGKSPLIPNAIEEVEVIIGKNQNARPGIARLGFQPAYAKFVNLKRVITTDYSEELDRYWDR